MHFRGLMFYVLLAVSAAVSAQSFPPTDHGTFKIVSNGQLLGTEKFDIEPAGEGYRFKADLRLKMPKGGDAVESSVLNVNRDLIVTSYTRVQKSPKKASVQVDFVSGNAKAHYITPDGPTDFGYMLEPEVVVLDTNFFHHFELLVQRYDFKKGGAQHVQVLIPQEASPGMMLMEMTGKDEGYDKFVVKTDAIEIHVWCDSGRRLMKLEVPAAKVQVVREAQKP